MTVTITAESSFAGNERLENVDYDRVSYKEIHKRDGSVFHEIRVKRGKRDKVFNSGVFRKIYVQDEETGRYLYKIAW